MEHNIETQRLALVPLRAAYIEVAQAGDDAALGELLGGTTCDEWANDDFRGILGIIAQQVAAEPTFELWSRLIVLNAGGELVGAVGAMALPDENGVIEIGFGVAPSVRGRGIATEAARGLIGWALNNGASSVIAHCLATNEPSIGVLAKLGERTGEVEREDGLHYAWTLTG